MLKHYKIIQFSNTSLCLIKHLSDEATVKHHIQISTIEQIHKIARQTTQHYSFLFILIHSYSFLPIHLRIKEGAEAKCQNKKYSLFLEDILAWKQENQNMCEL